MSEYYAALVGMKNGCRVVFAVGTASSIDEALLIAGAVAPENETLEAVEITGEQYHAIAAGDLDARELDWTKPHLGWINPLAN